MPRVPYNSVRAKDGSLTRYGFACGYIERHGNDESYIVLEQISSNGTLRVQEGGRWTRDCVYLGPHLKAARKAARNWLANNNSKSA